MADVFISYSKSRVAETESLAADLEGRGFTVWWDKDITPGEHFRDTINTELANARAAIVIWTPASVKSDWVISETTRAQRRGILIAVHSVDLNVDDIPAPFDVLHTVPIENRPSILAALTRMGVTPSTAAHRGDALSPAERTDRPGASRPSRSRRALLFGGGVMAIGAAATAVLYRPKLPQKLEPSGLLHALPGHDLYVTAVAYTIDGRNVMSGSWDQTLRLWDPVGEKEVRRFEGHDKPVWSVAMLPDGNHALSAGADSMLKLWDLSKSRPILNFKGHEDEVWSVAVLPDGNRALSASKDKTVKLWDLSNAKVIKSFPAQAAVPSVAVVPGGQVAVSVAKDLVQSWNLADGNTLQSFAGHDGAVNSVAVTLDSRQMLSGGDDATVRLWELSSGRELHKFLGHKGKVGALAVSPTGLTALSGGLDGTARLWDLTTGQSIRRFEGHTDAVEAVAIAPDGRTAVTGSRDKTLKIWDLQ